MAKPTIVICLKVDLATETILCNTEIPAHHLSQRKQEKKIKKTAISAAQKAIYDQKKERRALEKKVLGKIKDDTRNDRVKRYWEKKKHIAFTAEDIAKKRESILKFRKKQERLADKIRVKLGLA